MQQVEISIVSPVYNAEKILPQLLKRIHSAMAGITESYEVILVNDASPDDSWSVIQSLAAEDDRVLGINLSRNFGQHPAITAGLERSNGNWVVVMDCDLQDQPEEIARLYKKACEGNEIVLGRRAERKDSFIKKTFSRLFYKVLSYLTDTHQDPSIANFGIYKRKVIESILSMRDYNRYFPTMVRWVGYRIATVDIEHSERDSGESSYSFRKLINLALEVIISFSDKPLRLIVKLGAFVSFLSFLFAIRVIVQTLIYDTPVAGWPSLIVAIGFFSGLIILTLGIIGLYLGKIFDKVKDRPVYIVAETTSDDDVR